jgi:hypothetical protein
VHEPATYLYCDKDSLMQGYLGNACGIVCFCHKTVRGPQLGNKDPMRGLEVRAKMAEGRRKGSLQ